MKNCPRIVHTLKGRVKALEYVRELKYLNSLNEYTYKIYHEYDVNPNDVYVKTSIQPSVFELLLARILFEAAEIDDHYALGQEEIADSILNELYGVNITDEEACDEEFDLYYVWEKWCGVYNEVMELVVFDNFRLREALVKIIPVSV